MRKVRIQWIKLLNFKGQRELEVAFNAEGKTVISGKNGSGKSSIFDAFTWCLFGKDSLGRKDFEIKTIDPETGRAIPKIPHEVTCCLEVDGEEITIKRTYEEKWVKRRGVSDVAFMGHEESRYINDVPMKVQEFQDRIAEDIISEDVFRTITSTTYFLSLSTQVQRDVLLSMAGGISNVEIAKQDPRFDELLKELNGRSLEDKTAEVRSKIARIKKELTGMPERIDEAERSIPVVEVTEEELYKQLSRADEALNEIQRKLEERTGLEEERQSKVLLIQSEIYGVKSEIKRVEQNLREVALSGYYAEREQQDKLRRDLEQKKRRLAELPSEIASEQELLKQRQDRILALRAEWEATKKPLTAEVDLFCPTCKQALPDGDVQERKAELTRNYQAQIAKERKRINEAGSREKEAAENIYARIARLEETQHTLQYEIESLEQNPVVKKDLTTEPTPEIESKKLEQLLKRLQELEEQAEAHKEESVDEVKAELQQERAKLQAERDRLQQQVFELKRAKVQEERVEELRREFTAMNNELARLEGIDLTIKDFERAKVRSVEDKINAMFELVTWRMYREQINGGFAETCEPLIKSVPYSSANNAARINAGIDIANTIAKHNGYEAPMFIENAESVNEVMAIDSQQILLVVSNDSLTIK